MPSEPHRTRKNKNRVAGRGKERSLGENEVRGGNQATVSRRQISVNLPRRNRHAGSDSSHRSPSPSVLRAHASPMSSRKEPTMESTKFTWEGSPKGHIPADSGGAWTYRPSHQGKPGRELPLHSQARRDETEAGAAKGHRVHQRQSSLEVRTMSGRRVGKEKGGWQ